MKIIHYMKNNYKKVKLFCNPGLQFLRSKSRAMNHILLEVL